MRRLSLVSIAIAVSLAAGACSGDRAETATEQCARVRERLVQLELPLTDTKREAHARVMRRAMGDAFVERCTRSMTVTQRRCVLDATRSKDAFACTANANQQAVAAKGTK